MVNGANMMAITFGQHQHVSLMFAQNLAWLSRAIPAKMAPEVSNV
jgi:hypothetical protein